MPKKKAGKGHASFAHPPNKYLVAVNLQDADVQHKVNATVKDSRVNVFGQHVDEIKTKDGEVRYNFHGFSNEFELPGDVDPDSLTLSMADNQTILIQGNKLRNREKDRRQSGLGKIPQESGSQTRPHPKSQTSAQMPTQPFKANGREDRRTENKQGPPSWKTLDLQARRTQPDNPIHGSTIPSCEPPNIQWTRPKPVSTTRTPCCPLCCGPV